MQTYAISDSALLGGVDRLAEWVERLEAAGVAMVQIREKALEARELARIVTECLARCQNMRLLVNGRVDVALACGAHGAHLPAGSPAPIAWRGIAPSGFLFGVSCHSSAEAVAAQAQGADFIVAAPVFDPLSKSANRQPLGVVGLERICGSVSLPVFALGGVTHDNAAECVAAGARGVAGITMFRS